jgi:hypothetical protein
LASGLSDGEEDHECRVDDVGDSGCEEYQGDVDDVEGGGRYEEHGDHAGEHPRPPREQAEGKEPQAEEDLCDEVAVVLQVQEQHHQRLRAVDAERGGVGRIGRHE